MIPHWTSQALWLFRSNHGGLEHSPSVCRRGDGSTCNAGDPGSIPGSGRSPGEGNGNPLQYSCLGNPMDRGAWQATVHGVICDLATKQKVVATHVGFFHVCLSQHCSLGVVISCNYTYNVNNESENCYVSKGRSSNIWDLFTNPVLGAQRRDH